MKYKINRINGFYNIMDENDKVLWSTQDALTLLAKVRSMPSDYTLYTEVTIPLGQN